MRLIDADALLKKTINNPLHVPYITRKDVIDMPSALNNQVNLCDSCTYTYPECPSEKDDVIFGNGIGNDNICACNKYQPTIQPEPQWIPVSERLPETEEFVLASLTGKYRNITFEHTCEIADYADGEWCVYAYPHMSAEKCAELIEAWMPLPEPYKPNNK